MDMMRFEKRASENNICTPYRIINNVWARRIAIILVMAKWASREKIKELTGAQTPYVPPVYRPWPDIIIKPVKMAE